MPKAFELQATDGRARAGLLRTAHGDIETPIFMPVGTAGTVKGVQVRDLEEEVRAQIILSNTYHLFLRPGIDVVEAAGGIQEFSRWRKPMLTDSGGYQIFSLSKQRKITEEGATFRSHIDGTKHLFTPESVMDIQRCIGADVIMAFDECPAADVSHAYAKTSMQLTHRWLDRCVASFGESLAIAKQSLKTSSTDITGKASAKTVPGGHSAHGYPQLLFPICQGVTFPDLRRESAEYVASKDLPGNAIGGLSVGEPAGVMYPIVEQVCEILPADKPRYLMGVGKPENLLECIERGVDMFDCVLPSRNARHGNIYSRRGEVNIRRASYANDHSPVDPDGPCALTRDISKAYLRHLTVAREALGQQIATIHNLTFYLWLVGEARRHILAGTFARWKADIIGDLQRKL